MLKDSIFSIGTVASIISLAAFDIPGWGKWAIVAVGLFCLAYLIYENLIGDRKHLKVCKSKEETREFMFKWIQTEGKVCVMSRDLSWVDPDMENMMGRKKDSLIVFVQKKTPLTDRLENRGVVIHDYGWLGFEPQSRFTIIRCNRQERQIAIANTKSTLAKKKNYRHTIYQTDIRGDMKDGWIMSLADDLIKLCGEACDKKGQK